MEEKISLNGVIDMHVHTAPDVCGRTYNDLELTAAAVRAGARAIVIKGHHCSTVARAALCNAYNRTAFDSNSFVMYGGLVLNYETGGLNPKAVQTALEMGAKIIWLPTVDAENDCHKHGRSGGIRMTNDRGVPLPELRRIFTLIKEYDAVLATGHISPEEIRCVVDSARNIGVQKIVITHPEYWVVDMSLEDQQELISDYNVILERCFMQPLKNGQWISNAERNLKAIRKLGAENSILSTDCGNPATPPWEESMRQYLQFMADHNVSRDELRAMTETILRDIKKDIDNGEQPGEAVTAAMFQAMRDALSEQKQNPLSIDDVTAMITGQIGQLAPMDEETADLFQQLAKKMMTQMSKDSDEKKGD